MYNIYEDNNKYYVKEEKSGNEDAIGMITDNGNLSIFNPEKHSRLSDIMYESIADIFPIRKSMNIKIEIKSWKRIMHFCRRINDMYGLNTHFFEVMFDPPTHYYIEMTKHNRKYILSIEHKDTDKGKKCFYRYEWLTKDDKRITLTGKLTYDVNKDDIMTVNLKGQDCDKFKKIEKIANDVKNISLDELEFERYF